MGKRRKCGWERGGGEGRGGCGVEEERVLLLSKGRSWRVHSLLPSALSRRNGHLKVLLNLMEGEFFTAPSFLVVGRRSA